MQFFLTKGLTKSAGMGYTVKFGSREAFATRATPVILLIKITPRIKSWVLLREEEQMTFAIEWA